MRTSTIGVAAALVLTACVTSRQARTVTPSAFLGPDARLLQKAQTNDDVLLVYHKDGTKWASYDKVILDPVAIWTAESRHFPADQMSDYQKLVDSFQQTLTGKLAKNYTIVQQPAPGVLRIQTAIVNGAQANNTLKVAKTIAPYASFADLVWTFATGKPAFAGEVSLEYMIRDAQTNDLLGAGADRRVGGNQLGRSTFTTWGDVQNILTYWSDLTVYRLCVDRAGASCQRPSAGILEPR